MIVGGPPVHLLAFFASAFALSTLASFSGERAKSGRLLVFLGLVPFRVARFDGASASCGGEWGNRGLCGVLADDEEDEEEEREEVDDDEREGEEADEDEDDDDDEEGSEDEEREEMDEDEDEDDGGSEEEEGGIPSL